MHPQLLNDMATARRAELGREAEQRSRARSAGSPRAPRPRARVLAGLLLKVVVQIDPAAVPVGPPPAATSRGPVLSA